MRWSSSAPCEERLARRGLRLRRCRHHGFSADLAREVDDVLADLRLAVAPDEGHTTVERVHDRATVAHDGVVDLATDGVLDILDPDAVGRVGPVQDEPDLLVGVTEL